MASRDTRIYLCGRFVAAVENRRIETALPGKQGRLLFAYLALERQRKIPRDELIAAIWGEEPPPRADSALAALLSKIRKCVPGTLEGRSEVLLDIPGAWVDVEAAEEALHRAESAVVQGRWAEAWSPVRVTVHVTARGFMDGVTVPWIVERRERVRQLRCRALECYSSTSLRLGGTELPAAERSARSLVALEPYQEAGYRLLMETLAARGDAIQALQVYERLRSLLREELGVGPGPETRMVHTRLLELCAS